MPSPGMSYPNPRFLPGTNRWRPARRRVRLPAVPSSRGARMKMHDGEFDIDAELVRRLVAAQFHRLTYLPITEVQPTGTVNAIYRLGDHLCVRLPRKRSWARALEKGRHWLPKLAPRPSPRVPAPVAMGRPP